MRTTTEIKADITKLAAADRAYNRVLNEGGEGYERNSTSALTDEYLTAEAREFAADWTPEVLAARRAEWNAEVAKISAKYGRQIPQSAVLALPGKLGYQSADIARAKRLHGVV